MVQITQGRIAVCRHRMDSSLRRCMRSKACVGVWIAVVLTGAVALINWRAAWIPGVVFSLVSLAACFVHSWGFYLPIIYRGTTTDKVVALTFDDGPDPATTPDLLKLLKKYGVTATFFVTGKKAGTYPTLIRAIIAEQHTLGNHSYHHDSLDVFRGVASVRHDLAATQQELLRHGVRPLLFRPPVGITYPGLGQVLRGLDLAAVTFSCRAYDWGNKRIDRLAQRILRRVAPGDIIMLHDIRPSCGAAGGWLAEVELILAGLSAKGLAVRPLAELIGRPVDQRTGPTPVAFTSAASDGRS